MFGFACNKYLPFIGVDLSDAVGWEINFVLVAKAWLCVDTQIKT